MTDSKTARIDNSQVGVVGDNATIQGGVHFHNNGGGDWLSKENEQTREHINALRNDYLNRLFCDSGILTLEGIDPKAAACEAESQLNLSAVYTALLTHTASERQVQAMERAKPLPVLEVLNQNQSLVILGDPGSGKTTFVNFVALCMAGEWLGNDTANLQRLVQPLETDDDEDPHAQQWDHGALLPVRIILRDFAAATPPSEESCAATLWRFIEAELDKAALGEYAPFLKQELHHNGGLLLFDGLDEVPEADDRRVQIKAIVEDVVKTFGNCRVIVTSRTYAYQRQDWRMMGMQEIVLAPFSRIQIGAFIQAWYTHAADSGRIGRDDAQSRTALLKNAVLNNPRIRELAERPLLLTLIASLHAWRGGSLPEKREELYADTVDLLLDWWERPKTIRDRDGNIVIDQPSIRAFLKIEREQLRRMLNELAHRAHADQTDLNGVADIAEKDLIEALWNLSKNPAANPHQLMRYLNERAGLLQPRGVGVYSFPHRTIQEYLAACDLTDWDFPDEIAELSRKNPNRWREVCLLAGAKAARGASSSIWSLAEALCHREPDDIEVNDADVWGALLAGQNLAENALLERVSPRNQSKLKRIKNWLVRIIEGNRLPAVERALGGVCLAKLGDERKDGMDWDGMLFCFVPPGGFYQGDDPKDETITPIDHGFWISRDPVSQSQFNAFVQAGGYGKAQYWTEARTQGYWKGGKVKGRFDDNWRDAPEKLNPPFDLPNHPVVGISWFEAVAYSRWLADQWQERLNTALEIRLPHQVEWEKAARGGLETLASPLMRRMDAIKNLTGDDFALQPNSRSRREYPWGDASDPEKMNYSETAIGATTALGVFSEGVSPYGCRDMSGNVWEWCMDKEGAGRVIRGRSRPGGRSSYLGFRLVLRPVQQKAG